MPAMGRLVAAAVILLAAACADSGTTTTSEPPATSDAVTTTEPASTTTTAPPATTTTLAGSTTTAPPTTITTPATTTTVAPTTTAPVASFTITAVIFGENGFVEVTNVGNAPGDIGGHWICQRPSYFEIPSQVLEPGESVWIARDTAESVGTSTATAVFGAEGRLGQFSPRTGEAALYASSSFSNPDEIRSFVEWGVEGGFSRGGRAGVAAEAGIWEEGALVPVAEGAIGLTATTPPTDGPDDWIADVGG